MSETLRDIGATFSAITVTKCDMVAVGDGLTAERSEGAEWEPVIAIGYASTCVLGNQLSEL